MLFAVVAVAKLTNVSNSSVSIPPASKEAEHDELAKGVCAFLENICGVSGSER